MNIKSIKAVAFDAVGTLIYPTPAVTESYYLFGRKHGSLLARNEVKRRFKEANIIQKRIDVKNEFLTSEKREMERWREIVTHVFDDVENFEECFNELHNHFSVPESWPIYSGAKELLEYLNEKGIRMIVASNFDYRLKNIVKKTDIGKMCETILVSSKLGYRKPNSEFFISICNELELSKENILYVGDDLENDYQGARAIGMPAVLLDKNDDGENVFESLEALSEEIKTAYN